MTEFTARSLPHLVRIPRALLHISLDGLAEHGVSAHARDALRALLADLPIVPDASLSAQLIGARDVTLPCLAVLARHVGQGLRDHNLSLAHDRARLRAERQKLAFLDARTLLGLVAEGDERPAHEAVLFVADYLPALADLLTVRENRGLASFVTSPSLIPALSHWRPVHLGEPGT